MEERYISSKELYNSAKEIKEKDSELFSTLLVYMKNQKNKKDTIK